MDYDGSTKMLLTAANPSISRGDSDCLPDASPEVAGVCDEEGKIAEWICQCEQGTEKCND